MGGAKVSESTWRELARQGISAMDSIATTMRHIGMASLAVAGVGRIDVDDDGVPHLLVYTAEEKEARDSPPLRISPGITSTLGGSGGVVAWVFKQPPPYNDVEIVCSPDADSALGQRCTATKKYPGNERRKFVADWKESS